MPHEPKLSYLTASTGFTFEPNLAAASTAIRNWQVVGHMPFLDRLVHDFETAADTVGDRADQQILVE